MRRREFISLLGGAVAAWPFAARAQQAAMPIVGVLNMQTPQSEGIQLSAIRQGLKESGFIEGQNMTFDLRFAEGRNDRLPILAAELVRRPVNVIVANTTPPAIAAKKATNTTPIVFAFGADPVELGLVTSFNRPGGNITGVAFLVNKLVAKRFALLCETVPKSTVIGMLFDRNNPNAKSDVQLTQAAANALGRTLVIANVATENELDAAFASMVEQRAGALFVAPNANFRIWRNRLLTLVANHRLPSSYSSGDFVRVGGLMSYGPDQADAYRQAGIYAGRVLKGEKPTDLPVVQPTKFEFVLNLKAAKALGLELPARRSNNRTTEQVVWLRCIRSVLALRDAAMHHFGRFWGKAESTRRGSRSGFVSARPRRLDAAHGSMHQAGAVMRLRQVNQRALGMIPSGLSRAIDPKRMAVPKRL